MICNIIFDWSGTLVDDLPAVWEASNYVLMQAGRPEISLEQFRAEFCLPFQGFYDRYTPDVPMTQLEEWFHRRFRQVQSSVIALPHAEAFLQFCRQQRIRTFLLSTVAPEHYATQNRVIDFGQYLERPYVGIWDKRQKIREILAENQLQPAETLFIGDMQHDIETARHGGIHSCAVLTGYNTLPQLRASQPELIVEHLGELQTILRQNNFSLGSAAPTSEGHPPPIATVGGLIFNAQNEILLVRTHKWSNLWGIPGGKIKWGETAAAALQRELKEETNLTVDQIQFVLVQDCIHSPEFYRDAHFVLLNYTCRCEAHSLVKLNDESQEFRWLNLEASLQMPLNTPTRVLIETVIQQTPQP
ncbi:MAG TPA: NUDIX domain-containing protein [Verrucomicrobiota bacterium]|nr:NUDIX domain-containing protein [Verrucomicrobiota bacterium]HNT16251.1 NUDIX domain-containing protein [Verrucomicrobiota bacterium]